MGKRRAGPAQLRNLERGHEVQTEQKKQRQEEFLYILERVLWNITETCRRIGINRTTYYKWCQEPEFAERLKDAKESQKDMVVSSLLRNCAEGKSPDIKFYLTTQARDRGFIEKSEIQVDMDIVARAERGELTSEELRQAIALEQRKIAKAIEAGVLDMGPNETEESS